MYQMLKKSILFYLIRIHFRAYKFAQFRAKHPSARKCAKINTKNFVQISICAKINPRENLVFQILVLIFVCNTKYQVLSVFYDQMILCARKLIRAKIAKILSARK